MITIILSSITTIVVCVLGGIFGICQARINKRIDNDIRVRDKRAEQRKTENLLSIKLAHANTQLSIGVATAIKTGHANGEIEKGLELVNQASSEYTEFLTKVANEHLSQIE